MCGIYIGLFVSRTRHCNANETLLHVYEAGFQCIQGLREVTFYV